MIKRVPHIDDYHHMADHVFTVFDTFLSTLIRPLDCCCFHWTHYMISWVFNPFIFQSLLSLTCAVLTSFEFLMTTMFDTSTGVKFVLLIRCLRRYLWCFGYSRLPNMCRTKYDRDRVFYFFALGMLGTSSLIHPLN